MDLGSDIINFYAGFTFHSFSSTNVRNDVINELPEVYTYWQIDKYILEKTDHVISGKAANTP